MPNLTTARQLADTFVRDLADLDPSVATGLGLNPQDDRLPDLSPAGYQAKADLASSTLAELETLEAAAGPDGWDALEQRCATLLRDRLGVQLEAHAAGEHLREIRNIFGPPQAIRQILSMMPSASDADWTVIARRMARVPQAYRSWTQTLDEGIARGLFAAPLQVRTTIDQLTEWADSQWWHNFVAGGPESVKGELIAAADTATAGTIELRDYLQQTYLPASDGTPNAVGAQRYRLNARRWMGADLDLEEACAWGWAEYQQINAEMVGLAGEILPGSTPVEAMRHLDEHGEIIEGVEQVREKLQQMMDQAIEDLDGTHFDIAEPIKTVEAMIAPAGSAAAPYYSRPSIDFSRPGRTWLPTMGRTSFPMYDLVSTWYHEGVPGHHLQLAQWVYVAPQLSIYQTSLGSSSGATEGWALYAERLMDELGYLDTEARMGYLDCQIMRAIRVVIDIGMHLQLPIPDDSPIAPGQTWTPELANQFFAAHSGRSQDFIDSEIIRYLGWPGQAISYKLGERAWLAGREAARRAHKERGEEFNLKEWHMAALSLGALGLDDLTRELSTL
ncbi:DUF885 domain-containing protein [Ornithinimicrobium ciconiae]|uniref:DUF885 domain-containing protein n=1 Tax=Ornithinimicrobium ciconiae TaxID=2594265 RepID=A0A516G8P9_9MICO|nr:DUF885 domain-containing protein [Ornithinimicrobium ciconiae]QDO87852.1 DUF885 domain-containing protein [Ornithinimicrobium ciconiae]